MLLLSSINQLLVYCCNNKSKMKERKAAHLGQLCLGATYQQAEWSISCHNCWFHDCIRIIFGKLPGRNGTINITKDKRLLLDGSVSLHFVMCLKKETIAWISFSIQIKRRWANTKQVILETADHHSCYSLAFFPNTNEICSRPWIKSLMFALTMEMFKMEWMNNSIHL